MSESSTQQFVFLQEHELMTGSRDRVFYMPDREWKRLVKRVASIRSPVQAWVNFGWACVGIGTSAALSLVAWVGAYSMLPPEAQLSLSWIGPLMFTAAVGACIIAALCYAMNRTVVAELTRDKEHVLEDMDAIYETYAQAPHPASEDQSSNAATSSGVQT